MILAVDTSLGTAVAVIDADGRTVAEASTPDPLGHAEVIGDLLSRVVRPGITHVVAGMGPGPFTGLRIGIAAARAFAFGRGVPLVPVPSHFAIALDAPDEGPFAVVTDARRREIAVSVFDGADADGIPNLITPTRLEKRGVELDEPAHEATELSAAALARVGARAIASGRVLADVEPLYLRSPDVVQPGAPKRVGS
ncbi:tRNA (adenosine(37)-N6)-threonylcarbamoyltransferase complex dimerization subunit type 1 TsaB [Microbacterium esteraromaticum]|uniref:tRNA (Adenosine(37)-N6)-threonylcarbamoyltransferase complex dimerization subunit type 1 TsaB n=1 Tax=Microbacterium esteraromaticum TaxID=57043 RepID=A0A7D7WB20_9MICO|nr:tRNA (adenosine(37)-N6)-threonylcarbamoyltransferase complex dimerization subunit type 1 TsaB [Microbacterium esteraromaticum]QMU97438.1 tRNA (adenosine(37)-N6)-threonylcarbamoyltransferase complex dimerization subunit type 1 TsaB [Microbacterium esteraromaticum]